MTNIYQKLQEARVELQKKAIKKSGKNTFAGYEYFTLDDVLPHINQIFMEKGLFSQVAFGETVATLSIINAEKPEEKVDFTSPLGDISLKGAHAIQNLGAVQTYTRRYLYLNAMEISEQDELDATHGKTTASSPAKNAPSASNASTNDRLASDKQVSLLERKIEAMAKKSNVTVQEVKEKMGVGDLAKLTSKQASAWIDKLN